MYLLGTFVVSMYMCVLWSRQKSLMKEDNNTKNCCLTNDTVMFCKKKYHFMEKHNVLRTDSYYRWSMRDTDERLIFLLLHHLPSLPCFLLLCRNTIAGSCLCPANSTRKLLSTSNRGFADIGFSNVIYPSLWPRSFVTSVTCIKHCWWFIIRVRRPAKRRLIPLNSNDRNARSLLTRLDMFVPSFLYLLIRSIIKYQSIIIIYLYYFIITIELNYMFTYTIIILIIIVIIRILIIRILLLFSCFFAMLYLLRILRK